MDNSSNIIDENEPSAADDLSVRPSASSENDTVKNDATESDLKPKEDCERERDVALPQYDDRPGSRLARKRLKTPGRCEKYRTNPYIRLLSMVLMLCIIGSSVYYLFRKAKGSLRGLEGLIRWWDDKDAPGVGDDKLGHMEDDGTFVSWRANGKNGVGLILTVENACTDDWDEHFEAAVFNWDNLGNDLEKYDTTDIITLKTRKTEWGAKCAHTYGILRVCNDDYGDTGWKGVNEVRVLEGRIISSVARMNDYYFKYSDAVQGGAAAFKTDQDLWAKRRYTMCHEMGHGLGLGHADNDFGNADLGTCMDYTLRQENNLTPNEDDFVKLGKLYSGVFLEASAEEVGMEDAEWKKRKNEDEENKQTKTNTVFNFRKLQGIINDRGGYNKIKDRKKRRRFLQNDALEKPPAIRTTKEMLRGSSNVIFSYLRNRSDGITKIMTEGGKIAEVWTYYTPL